MGEVVRTLDILMVGLFTSSPTNWGPVREKFWQVNWPWNSGSYVNLCTPWLSISWHYRPICQSTCQLSIGRLLITLLVDCWLTCWSTLDHYVGQCVGQHTSQYTSQHLADTRGVNCGGISVDYWWHISWLSYALNSLLTPQRPYLFQAHLRGSSLETGGLFERGVFNLEKTMVSVLHKDLEYIVDKGWRSCSQGSKTNPNFQLVNKVCGNSPLEVKQSWLINAVYYC